MNNLTIENFYVVGIATRTTNVNGQSALDIENLWQQFWAKNIQEQVVNKSNDAIYAVYTDYETDHTGPYTTVVGYAVSSVDNIPAGLVAVPIIPGTYKKITSKGKMPKAIFNTWLAIWSDDNLSATRSYRTDFTVHGEKYHDGEDAEVDTFLSVK